ASESDPDRSVSVWSSKRDLVVQPVTRGGMACTAAPPRGVTGGIRARALRSARVLLNLACTGLRTCAAGLPRAQPGRAEAHMQQEEHDGGAQEERQWL